MNGIQRNQIAALESAIKTYLAPNLEFIGLDIEETGNSPNTLLDIRINFKNCYGDLTINHRGIMRDSTGQRLKKFGRINWLPKLTKLTTLNKEQYR